MALNPKGFGVTLTDATDTVIYTVPPNTTSTITNMILVSTINGTSADVNLKVGGRNTTLLKTSVSNNGINLLLKTTLMPGETLIASASLAATIDLNVSLIDRSM